VRFESFDREAYELFLRCKELPELRSTRLAGRLLRRDLGRCCRSRRGSAMLPAEHHEQQTEGERQASMRAVLARRVLEREL